MTSVGQTQASVPSGKPEQSPALVGKHVAQQFLKNSRWLFSQTPLTETPLKVMALHRLEINTGSGNFFSARYFLIFLVKFAFPLHNSNFAGCSLAIYLEQAGPTTQKTLVFPKSCKKRPLYYDNYLNSVSSPFFASSLSAGFCAPLHYRSRVNFL